jgi:hypothetical protein
MPTAPGSRIYPAVENTRKSSSVSVSNKPKDDGGIPAEMPVPGSADYVPATKVAASSNAIEPSA